MSDPVNRTLADLENPSLFTKETGVPIFCPHIAKKSNAKTGQMEEVVVTEEDLPLIVQNINSRVTRTGNLVKGSIGHFRYDKNATETDQPDIVCFYKDAAVGRYGPQQTVGILATRYIRRGFEKMVRRDFPERSADYYPGSKEITAVASLKRDAELDLGVISYREELGGVICYRREGLAIRYMGGTQPMDEPVPAPALGPENGDDPAKPPSSPAPSEQFMAHCDHYMKTRFPHLPAMHAKHVAQMAAETAPPHAPPVPAMPPPLGSDTTGAAPQQNMHGSPAAMWAQTDDAKKRVQTKDGSAYDSDAMDGNWHSKMSREVTPVQNGRTPDLVQLQRTVQAQGETIKQLMAANTENAKTARVATRRNVLQALQRPEDPLQYGLEFDLEEEVKEAADMTVEQFERHLNRLRRICRPSIASGPFVPVAANGSGAENGQMTPELDNAVQQYIREHCGVTYDDALKFARERLKSGR